MNLFRMPFIYMSLMSCCVTLAGSVVHGSPLSDAAAEYQHAVKQFEIDIYKRGYDRHSKRVVQDLEEAAIRMRSASHQPHQRDRLECAWQEIQVLHPQVEAAFFAADRHCAVHPDLALSQSWQLVNCALIDLAQAVDCVCNLHGHIDTAPTWLPSLSPSAPGFPYRNYPQDEHLQSHPPLSHLPNERRSSNRIEIPPAMPEHRPSPNGPYGLYGAPSQPRFPANSYDRPTYFGQGTGSPDVPSVLVDVLLRRLAKRFGG